MSHTDFDDAGVPVPTKAMQFTARANGWQIAHVVFKDVVDGETLDSKLALFPFLPRVGESLSGTKGDVWIVYRVHFKHSLCPTERKKRVCLLGQKFVSEDSDAAEALRNHLFFQPAVFAVKEALVQTRPESP